MNASILDLTLLLFLTPALTDPNGAAHSVWRKLNIFNWLVSGISYTLTRLLIGVLINYKVQDYI